MAVEFKKEDTPDTINMQYSNDNPNKFLIKEEHPKAISEPWKPPERTRSDSTIEAWKPPRQESEDKVSVSSKSSAETLDNIFHSMSSNRRPQQQQRQQQRPLFGGFQEYLNPNRTQQQRQESKKSDYSSDDAKSYRSEPSVGPSFRSRVPANPGLAHKPPNNMFRKKELLGELKELSSRGYDLQDSYNMSSRVEDLENEVRLGNKYFETISWQHIVEQGFFSCVWGIEQSTTVFNPMNLKLQGLYESSVSNKEMISHEIALIVRKYIGENGDALPPEIKLGLILMGTIMFTHFSNHVTKNLADKVTEPGGLGNLFKSFAPMLSGLMGGNMAMPAAPSGPQPTQSHTAGASVPPPPQTSNDLNDIFSKLMPGGQAPPRQERVLPHPQPTRYVSKEVVRQPSVVSDDSGSEYSVTTLVNDGKGRKKKKKKTLNIF